MSALGPQHKTDFADTLDASRCKVEHPEVGRCGFVIDHDRPQHGVAVLEGRELVLHLFTPDEVRRVPPGPWGMAKQRLPWAVGYWFPEPSGPSGPVQLRHNR